MKRQISALILTCILLVLAGCAQEKKTEDPTQLILRYADNQPEDYPTILAAEYFAQLVEARTQGKICIRVYCDGILGDENSVLEQVQFGGIDMARISIGTLSDFSPEFSLLHLPYLYDDTEHMWRVLDGEIGNDCLLSIRKLGLIGMSWFDAGARSFYTNVPVTCVEDLAGLTIRVQESEFMADMVECMGANAVQLPYDEVYSALQTGKIDGAENNWPSYESTGHFEAAPYMLLDEHSRLPEIQIMSTLALDKIAQVDEDYVDIVIQCAKESAIYERQLWSEREKASEELVRSRGCVVTTLSSKQLEEFRTAVKPMYEMFTEEEQLLIEKIRTS